MAVAKDAKSDVVEGRGVMEGKRRIHWISIESDESNVIGRSDTTE